MAIDERLNNYDWECAFECCGSDGCQKNRYNEPSVSAAIGSTAHAGQFRSGDVEEILYIEDGENDGDDWIGIFRLRDGRFAFLTAGCDFTGWDCVSGGHAIVSHSLEHLIQFGVDVSALERFGVRRGNAGDER